MKNSLRVLLLAALAAAIGLHAQDAPPPDELRPRAAEMAPRATTSLLLALAQAGDRVVAAGDRGVILLSGDGASWEQVASPVHAALTAVSFTDPQHGWIVGHDATILHTADGGRSWQLQHFKPEDSKPLLSVLALDAQRAYATGAYGLFVGTTDGGRTWAPVDAPTVLEDGRHLNAVIRLGNGDLFIAGETGLVAVSADGSEWQRLTLPYEGSLFGALARGDKGALVFGLRGNVYSTDDVRAGAWKKVETLTVQSMFGGTRLASGDAALVGADGEIVLVHPEGSVRKARGPRDERSFGSGTLSGVIAHNGELLMVGETGVAHLKVDAATAP